MVLLVAYLISYHRSVSDPILQQIRESLIKIDPRASKFSFFKHNKSYSINKKKIYLCMEDKYGNYYSYNTLLYVALHELAHCLNTVDTGHSEAFNNMFRYLLQTATDSGLYNPNMKIPCDYCEH